MGTTAITVCFEHFATSSAAPKPIYRALASAQSDAEIHAALLRLSSLRRPQAPISAVESRKVFARVKRDAAASEGDACFLAGHLAAISGDAELLREMLWWDFGAAESESKGAYVEEFLQCHPDAFFALPDNWLLWHTAGGAAWCCNDPGKTVPILANFAARSTAAQRMLDDVRDTATHSESDTQWGAQTRAVLR